jgi:hypothetical protein
VYGPTPDPELRLITCGTFDYATGHYLSNTVVYAAEVACVPQRESGARGVPVMRRRIA